MAAPEEDAPLVVDGDDDDAPPPPPPPAGGGRSSDAGSQPPPSGGSAAGASDLPALPESPKASPTAASSAPLPPIPVVAAAAAAAASASAAAAPKVVATTTTPTPAGTGGDDESDDDAPPPPPPRSGSVIGTGSLVPEVHSPDMPPVPESPPTPSRTVGASSTPPALPALPPAATTLALPLTSSGGGGSGSTTPRKVAPGAGAVATAQAAGLMDDTSSDDDDDKPAKPVPGPPPRPATTPAATTPTAAATAAAAAAKPKSLAPPPVPPKKPSIGGGTAPGPTAPATAPSLKKVNTLEVGEMNPDEWDLDKQPGRGSMAVTAKVVAAPKKPSTEPKVDDDSDEEIAEWAKKSAPGTAAAGTTAPASAAASAASAAAKEIDINGVKMARPVDVRYEIIKATKFGFQQKRVLYVNEKEKCMRFLDGTTTKTEFPFSQLQGVLRNPMEDLYNQITLMFTGGARNYTVKFAHSKDMESFTQLAKLVIIPPAARLGFGTVSAGAGGATTAGGVRTAANPALPSGLDLASKTQREELAKTLNEQQDYVEYHVTLKGGMLTHARIFVLYSKRKTFSILDDKRKLRHEHNLADVMSIEIPMSNQPIGGNSGTSGNHASQSGGATTSAAAQAAAQAGANKHPEIFIVFKKTTKEKPINFEFNDASELQGFCARMCALNPEIDCKDEADTRDNPDDLRFIVDKVNKVGARKRRVLTVLKQLRCIRSFDNLKQFKDTGFSKIQKIEAPFDDRCKATIWMQNGKLSQYVFADPTQREKFLIHYRTLTAASADERLSPLTDPVTIFVGTWNCGSAGFPTAKMDDFIPPKTFDIYVIGLQECPKGPEWVHGLKMHVNKEWRAEIPEEKLFYTMVANVKLWEMILIVFVRTKMLPHVTNIETDTLACGVGDVLGNKGGIGVTLKVSDTSLAFVNSHLAARATRVKERRENYQKIVKGLKLGRRDIDLLHQFDHVIWCGDLNYRNDLPFKEVIKLVADRDWANLRPHDQLAKERAVNHVFYGFKEPLVDFQPTYRYERKENIFSNKKAQSPSWCDRVLSMSLPELNEYELVHEKYGNTMNQFGSDHRPVWSTFHFLPRSFYNRTAAWRDMINGFSTTFMSEIEEKRAKEQAELEKQRGWKRKGKASWSSLGKKLEKSLEKATLTKPLTAELLAANGTSPNTPPLPSALPPPLPGLPPPLPGLPPTLPSASGSAPPPLPTLPPNIIATPPQVASTPPALPPSIPSTAAATTTTTTATPTLKPSTAPPPPIAKPGAADAKKHSHARSASASFVPTVSALRTVGKAGDGKDAKTGSGDHAGLVNAVEQASGKRMRAEILFYELKLVETGGKLEDDEKKSLGISICATFIDKDVQSKYISSRGSEVTFHTTHVSPFIGDLDFLTSRHLTLHIEYEKKPDKKQSLQLTTHATFGYAMFPMRPVVAPATVIKSDHPLQLTGPAPTTAVAQAAAAIAKDAKSTTAPAPAPAAADSKTAANQSPLASVAAAAAAAARFKEQAATTPTTGAGATAGHEKTGYQFRLPVLREGQIVGQLIGGAVIRYRVAPNDFKDVFVAEKAPY